MQIELDPAAAAHHAVEDRFPKVVAPFGDAALAMGAKREAADGGTGLQHRRQRVAAIRRMVGGVQSLGGVIRVGAVGPLVGVRPEAQLELEAAHGGLVADESQHFEIAVALGIRQAHGPDIVTRDGNQEGVGEKEIGFGDGLTPVVAQPQGEAETVEPLRGQHGEIARPELPVVEPGLVFHIAAEQAGDATGGVCGPLDDRFGDGERGHGVGRELHPVGKFEKGVN